MEVGVPDRQANRRQGFFKMKFESSFMISDHQFCVGMLTQTGCDLSYTGYSKVYIKLSMVCLTILLHLFNDTLCNSVLMIFSLSFCFV